MSNPLLSLLDIDYPLIQAPMAGVSTPALAAAVMPVRWGSLGLGASIAARAEAMIVATASRRPPVQCQSVLPCAAPARRSGGSRLGNNITSPFCPLWQYATGFVAEIYQTFIGHAPMLELLLDISPAVVSHLVSS